MKVSVLDIAGKETGKEVELSDAVYGVEPNTHAIYLDVKQFLANQRQGTHKAKERADIAGSTRKIKKQKGTGGARAGSLKSPVFVGGGRVFGPRPRDYRFKLNKNLKRLARKSALSLKAKDDSIVVLEDFDFDVPKTKNFMGILEALNLRDKKTLFVFADANKNVYLSSRNLKNSNVVNASQLNTYDIMNAGKLILCQGAVEKIEANLNK